MYLCRQKQLEDILVLAKQFHETAEPISDFLSVTEKKLANSEPVGTQTAKIHQQIIRHKVGRCYDRQNKKTGGRNLKAVAFSRKCLWSFSNKVKLLVGKDTLGWSKSKH